MSVYVLYMLRCSDGSLYTGITNSIEKRLSVHSQGRGSKYVAGRLPFTLVYVEGPFNSKSDALKREWVVKRLTKASKESLVKEVRNPLQSFSY